MQVDWLKLVPALLLLLTPIGLFHGRRVKFRALMRDWQGYWLRTLGLGLHTIDLGRATLGVWLLLEALHTVPGAQPTQRYLILIIHTAILGTATVLQTLVCKEPEAANAPFAFVIGLVLGAFPPVVALFALVLTIALAVGANAPAVFFPLLVVAVSALGFLFHGKKLQLDLITVGLPILLPWLVTLLFPRHFVCAHLPSPRVKATTKLK